MTFTQGERVLTPQGPGTVVYQRMKGPDYREAEAVSVWLDHIPGKQRRYYNGTIFVAEVVALLPTDAPAPRVCPNCEQWAHPIRTAKGWEFDCLNRCQHRGLAHHPGVEADRG